MRQEQAATLTCPDPRKALGLPADVPMLVALSGGADSVALLSLMAQYPPLEAIHVHHGIRGEEADRDAAFCQALTARLGIPLTVCHVNAPALASERGESLETAARDARYAAIISHMKAHRIPLLLTAHHADDQLETMLQHLLRGSGTRGLCGIPSSRTLEEGLLVARPLLDFPKEALLSYVKEQGLSFVTDSTNEELCCQRNFLRLRVLPLLHQLQPNASQMAARCAAALAGDEAYLDSLAADFLKKEGGEPSVAALNDLPRPVLVRVLRRLLPCSPSTAHIEAITRLLDTAKPHASLSLPPRTVLQIEGGRLLIGQKKNEAGDYAHILTLGENRFHGDGILITVAKREAPITPHDANLYKYTTRLSLNSAIIEGDPVARPRRTGDRISVGGMHRAVRRLSALAHLPLDVRRHMPILADDKGVLAVPFFTVRDGGDKNADLIISFYFN